MSSPMNPLYGYDDKWNDWYDKGLPECLSLCNVFVSVIDNVWDSSAWMAEESRQGQRLCRLNLYWNPEAVEVNAQGMMSYLSKALPSRIKDAVSRIEGLAT